ncbi:MAG: hypothetical protein DWQ02_21160 [Bacteroidetes bacterium]|nr:MAG: hypothetical protein DWQ02_21160 [Bacteroidota bacterium]
MPVVKSKTRKDNSFKQLVEYISEKENSFNQLLGYINKEDDKNFQSLTFLHNISGIPENDIAGITQAFQNNDSFRRQRKNGVVQYHEIISFSPKDREILEKDPDILLDMARKYLDWRAPNSLAIARPHFDTDHIHIHIMISGNQYMSRETSRVSQTEFNQIKQKLHEYQLEQYPELVHSIIEEHNEPKPKLEKDSNTQLETQEKEMTYSVEKNAEPLPDHEDPCVAELALDINEAVEVEQESVNDISEPELSPYWEQESVPSPYWEELEEESESDDESDDDED